MDAVGVLAVVGACGPERQGYARRLAQATNRALFPASRLVGSPDPVEEAAALASWTDPSVEVVMELPEEVSAKELIGAFADSANHTALLGLVCVVDAAHLLDDLQRDDFVPVRGVEKEGIATPLVARALLTVEQIEYASTIVVVNGDAISSPDLAVSMALLSHLSPRARIRLHADALDLPEPEPEPLWAFSIEQDRPGWVCLLNGALDPRMTDRRVSAVRYEQVRPLHPDRLVRLLDERIEPGEFGHVVRSAGFCRLASRPHIVAEWSHVGRTFSLNPLAADVDLDADDELLALGEDLAIIGLDLDQDALLAALDAAALTDDELAAGPRTWATFDDPFPAWATVGDRGE